MTKDELQSLKHELSVKAKNGINFIAAASIVWLIIAYVWTLPYSAYNKSILTFMVGGVMLIGLSVEASSIWIIPASLSGALAVPAVWLYFSYKRRAFKTL